LEGIPVPIQTYDTTDAIPEEHRDTALALADGKFAVVTDEDVSGLKANQAKLLEEKKQADKDRRELAKRLSDLEQQQKAAASGITSEQLAKLKADVELEYAPVREKAATLETQLRALKLDNAVQSQMAKAGVRGDRLGALWKLTGEAFDLTDDGQPYVKDAPTQSIDQFIGGKLKADYPEFFSGTSANGGGAKGSTGGSMPTKTISRSDTKAYLANIDGIAKGEVIVTD
jgi:hypothetical protein